MTAKGWDVQPSAPFKIGELVKVIAGSPGKRKGSFAIVVSEYYQNNYHGPVVDVVSGEQLQHPGDRAGSPGNTINCRCTLTYQVIDTEIE